MSLHPVVKLSGNRILHLTLHSRCCLGPCQRKLPDALVMLSRRVAMSKTSHVVSAKISGNRPLPPTPTTSPLLNTLHLSCRLGQSQRQPPILNMLHLPDCLVQDQRQPSLLNITLAMMFRPRSATAASHLACYSRHVAWVKSPACHFGLNNIYFKARIKLHR